MFYLTLLESVREMGLQDTFILSFHNFFSFTAKMNLFFFFFQIGIRSTGQQTLVGLMSQYMALALMPSGMAAILILLLLY